MISIATVNNAHTLTQHLSRFSPCSLLVVGANELLVRTLESATFELGHTQTCATRTRQSSGGGNRNSPSAARTHDGPVVSPPWSPPLTHAAYATHWLCRVGTGQGGNLMEQNRNSLKTCLSIPQPTGAATVPRKTADAFAHCLSKTQQQQHFTSGLKTY